MKVGTVIWVLSVFCIASMLAGCGGGGGGGGVTPTGTQLTIGADTESGAMQLTQATRSIQLNSPLDSGATVIAYDFRTGTEIARGTIGDDGLCRLHITPGLCVAIVVTGTRSGQQYRLSLLVPQVPVANAEYVANPVTSLAAEAIGQQHYRKGAIIDQGTYNQVVAATLDWLAAHTGANFSLSGGIIEGSSFGGVGSIDTSQISSIVEAVPTVIDSDVVLARNGVQQIKEAGVPLLSMLEQERPDIEYVLTDQVIARYSNLGQRLSVLILPALMGDMEYDSQTVSIFDLTDGQAYSVVENYDGWLLIEDDTAHNVSGQVTIRYATADGIYILVSRSDTVRVSLTETLSSDASHTYTAIVEANQSELGPNPSVTAAMSLQDKFFTTPITYNGSLSATGPNESSYSQMRFQGSLVSPNLRASGDFEVNFPSSLPSGADPVEDTVYDFPTSCSMSDASIGVTGGRIAVTLTGSISATSQPLMYRGGLRLFPRHVTLDGGYTNSSSGLDFEGTFTGDLTSESYGLHNTFVLEGHLSRPEHPTYYGKITYTDGATSADSNIDLRVGTNSLKGTAHAVTTRADHFSGYEVLSASLELINQSGVQFSLAQSESGVISGNIKAGSPARTVANISRAGDILRIEYDTDPVTFEEFLL